MYCEGCGAVLEPNKCNWKIIDISWDKEKNYFEVKAETPCYQCGRIEKVSWNSWNDIPKIILADIKCPRCGNEDMDVEHVHTSVSGKETQVSLGLKCRRCTAIRDEPLKKIFRYLRRIRHIEAGPNIYYPLFSR